MKNAIVQVDATPFKAWYTKHYGVEPGQKKRGTAAEPEVRMPRPFTCATQSCSMLGNAGRCNG